MAHWALGHGEAEPPSPSTISRNHAECGEGNWLLVGMSPPSATLQPPEVVTRREQRVPVPHAPLLAVGAALAPSGLLPSGQEKGWDILEAARLCWGHQYTGFSTGDSLVWVFSAADSGFDNREQLGVRPRL